MLTSLRHNLTSLTRFSGRDRRRQSWPYAGAVLALGFVTIGALNTLAFTSLFTQVSIQSTPQDDLALLAPMFWTVRLGALAMVALLAAAVVRRLHDRGRSGLWAAPTLAFLSVGTTLIPILFGQLLTQSPPPTWVLVLFGVLLLNNLAYLASLLMLLILLVKDSDAGANRYGAAA
ncbi:hypothetical protein DMC25_17420 [Caulobacter sp. D4A]|uniref:DUF805 domain-containing protein n=1 Tax=unclassified Caulobacter TaxID=2648921 RepID=UPI000D7260B9|nr:MULTISPECIES: DUF805 domain-containing protein [unclassified Caulobacter]PXA83870.1 hypothetical protein DMC25_17420 [Caulobacter sp. D4A]PXA85124.1 hypothetical protein DMC18_23205 [Caulobacter sp. D5]